MDNKTVRNSRQRNAVLENLMSRHDHPTAAEIYDDVKKEIPSLSLGTLYRNLTFLCDKGQIIRFSIGGEEHYDANTARHYHLKCEKCGRFYDLPGELIPEAENYAPPGFKGKINGYNLIFYGICEECSSKCR